mmetsp:Transcript_43752/g.114986  ORF Transcript_43752/g.114986 Transcript_43752/m.114986 type:complete len:159 (+) Transcript_43752:899-1375(+)
MHTAWHAKVLMPPSLSSAPSPVRASHRARRGWQVGAGALEATSRWLEPGDSVEWTVQLTSGADITVRSRFVPADADATTEPDTMPVGETCERLHADGVCQGRLAATQAGMLWLCLDNVSSWTKSKGARVMIACKRKEKDRPAAPQGAPPSATTAVDLS